MGRDEGGRGDEGGGEWEEITFVFYMCVVFVLEDRPNRMEEIQRHRLSFTSRANCLHGLRP